LETGIVDTWRQVVDPLHRLSFESMREAADWFDNTPQTDRETIGRNNAKKLFNLPT
jgi:hypothetical protein